MSRDLADRRARVLRLAAYRKITESRRFPEALRLGEIRRQAEHEFYSWTGRPVAWPWPDIAAQFRQNSPDRFDLAIWHGNTLCGLAIGKPSQSRRHLTVEFIEGNPAPGHPMKGLVIPVALAAADEYAALLGCKYVRLSNPAPALIPLYDSMGFRLATAAGETEYYERSTGL